MAPAGGCGDWRGVLISHEELVGKHRQSVRLRTTPRHNLSPTAPITPLWSGPFHLVVVMTRAELIIQLLKIAIGITFGAYFLWWSLAVLQRLPVH
jgi:hypothetical protein